MLTRRSRKVCKSWERALLQNRIILIAELLCAILVVGVLPISSFAEDEFRVGLMLQIPFGGSQHDSFVHFGSTRIGAKVQYADKDDIIKRNEQNIDRVYQDGELVNSEVTSEGIVTVSAGDKVVGVEGYLLVAPFTGQWTVSGGVNGFSGKEKVQGAVGLGYDPTFGGYVGIGALMPYSEAGLRFNFRYIDYYVGLTSLPGFSLETVWEKDSINYTDTYITTVEPTIPEEETE